MPKLPPPPRRAQNRSGLSVALACTSLASAVTTSAPTRLSAARPYLRINQPIPPPRVNPPTPVPEGPPAAARAGEEPAGDREAEGLRLVVDMSPGRPALRRGAVGDGVDGDRVHGRQVDHDSVVDGGETGDAVSAAAHRDRQVLAADELPGLQHVGGAGDLQDEGRPLVVAAVPQRPRFVVVAVGWPDHAAAQGRLELADRGFADDGPVGAVGRCSHLGLLGCRNVTDARKHCFAAAYRRLCSRSSAGRRSMTCCGTPKARSLWCASSRSRAASSERPRRARTSAYIRWPHAVAR